MDAPFPIIGVGASAGGVEALESLFRNMPPDLGAGFVIITHLAPGRESMLPEILARDTRMPVLIAENEQPVRRDHIYVAPPDTVLEIQKGRLRVRVVDTRERTPIDVFFAGLAEDQKAYAIGIVLSGSGSDGTLGIKAIKEHGGLTLAQAADGGSGPRHSSMPETAIASGLVDVAVAVEVMPERLLAYVRNFGILDKATQDGDHAEEARKAICGILLDQTGHDFSSYKTRTFYRRIERRMQVLQIPSLEAYASRLRTDPSEASTLFRDLLIGVTNFFRDTKAFEALEKLVVPHLFEKKGAQNTIRVWVPGCATGEEVYSLAVLLREQSEKSRSRVKVQIFATDIDESALAVARAGRYPANQLGAVSKERLARFFTAEGSTYVINKGIRDLCVFSSHSVVRDPPFSHMDLISCRNLLIYLNSELQSEVIPVFHYALRPNGFLFLGSSENLTRHADLFTALDKKNRVFQRRDDGPSKLNHLPALFKRHGLSAGERYREPVGRSLRQTIESRVLERYVPPHVVANREGDVIYYSGGTGSYLEAPPGRPNRSLIAMARKGLRLPLRSALHEAIEKGRTATRDAVALEGDEHTDFVKLTVEPMREDEGETLYLVVFTEIRAPAAQEETSAEGRKRGAPDPSLGHLERELRDMRERFQSMAEEYETAIEELKSSNEEMVSVNEELQSTNEELETSKEELQSVNEELQTVNHELTVKIDELDRANSDLKNLYDSTDIATIFLDRDLMVRSFTPAVTRIFNLIRSDRGRPLTDIAHQLKYAQLAEDVQQMFATQQRVERRVDRSDGSAHYMVRVLPYRTSADKIEGAVLTFTDVSDLVRSQEQHRVLVAERKDGSTTSSARP